ncbi:MAG: PEP-CTERM sorting domain-containing protein [Isosphaeraceae bacterium]|nr:PEP-CTERM sorting domain-containing protein [Isosphaeraceae bacterium]
MRISDFTRSLFALLAIALVSGSGSTALAGNAFSLDYNTLTVLPSQTGQGLVYGTSFPNPAETTAFRVQDKALRLFTPSGFSWDPSAYYQLANGYDSSIDVEITVRARVLDGSLDALYFYFGDNRFVGGFGIGPSRFGLPGVGNFIDFGVDPKVYHDYRYFSKGGSGKFTLSIDDREVYAGNLLQVTSGNSYAAFGHFGSTSASGYVTADIAKIRYDNTGVAAVPEPSTIGLAALGAVAGLATARRRLLGR